MESGSSQGCKECFSDFGFAFNNEKFSDRTILLNIISESTGYIDNRTSTWVPRKKRCRLNISNAVRNNGNQRSKDYTSTKTKTIHINTMILAAKSPFFYKMFTNGMAESNQQHVTLQIHESEEAAFMDILKFMYTNTLSESTPSALLDVLVAADKYEAASCMKYCCQSLQKLPITRESALLYLDLPSTILMAETVQSLKDAAKEFLVARFKDISKFQGEILSLPLVGIEAVLSSDDLQVSSEDEIYDFVMKWAEAVLSSDDLQVSSEDEINDFVMKCAGRNYTKPGKQQEMLIMRLLRLVRFPFLSRSKLEEILTCTLISLEQRSKLVFDALSLETSYRQLPPVKEQERAYKLRPLKVIRFDSPREKCVVYLDLKREECARLLPNGRIYSQSFDFAGQVFCLDGEHCVHEQSSFHSFGFFLRKQDKGSLGVEFGFSSIMKPSEEFVGLRETDNDFAEVKGFGFPNLFVKPWERFIADDSPYFINGVLHLKAVLKIKK